ncbi:nucleotide-diphospho-sugar transferase [Lipomyces oligophaga]|uniref:nucleotide-diphospho-sugar transferase n=1 Tax=Lipomyces oligophaga TaxID=45792 RepID=UPI0034CE1935
MAETAYISLLLNDSYLPGAVTLAKALRDTGTSRKLAILAVASNLSEHTLSVLEYSFDVVIRIPAIANPSPGNLLALGRPDLLYSFTKILAWNQIQFSRLVYLDADVLPLENLDDLFEVPGTVAACPDAGWPDIFNSGLVVFTPSSEDFQGLHSLAESGISFDGGDQGLLNTYFGSNWNHLPFLYNVTPTSAYQYAPAFAHFSKNAKACHFIGSPKPWNRPRPSESQSRAFPDWYEKTAADVNEKLLRRWWSVYDSVRDHLPDEPHEPHDDPSFSAIEPHDAPPAWDGSRSSPPQGGSGEASGLPKSFVYKNAWDKPYSAQTDFQFVAPDVTHNELYLPEQFRAAPVPTVVEQQQQQQQQEEVLNPEQLSATVEIIEAKQLHFATISNPISVAMSAEAHNEVAEDKTEKLEVEPEILLPRGPSPTPRPIFPWEMHEEEPAPRRIFPEDIRRQHELEDALQARAAARKAGNISVARQQLIERKMFSDARKLENEILNSDEDEMEDEEETLVDSLRGKVVLSEDPVTIDSNKANTDLYNFSSRKLNPRTSIEREDLDEEMREDKAEAITIALIEEEDDNIIPAENREVLSQELEEDAEEEDEINRISGQDAKDMQTLLALSAIETSPSLSSPPVLSPVASTGSPRSDAQISPELGRIVGSPLRTPHFSTARMSPKTYNAWDRDPNIVEFATHFSASMFGTRHLEKFPTSPTTGRLGHSSNTDKDINLTEEQEAVETPWDPFQKLEELSDMPARLFAQHLHTTEQDESTT